MLKKKKTNNPEVGNVYAIKLKDGTWTLSQLCLLVEVEGYYSTTFAFFDYKYKSKEELYIQFNSLELKTPFSIFTITEYPLKYKEWILIGNKPVEYGEIMPKNKINAWGWIDNLERDINWILEMYFGIYPWDGFKDKFFMDKILLPAQKKPVYARDLKSFTDNELKQLGIYDFIKR